MNEVRTEDLLELGAEVDVDVCAGLVEAGLVTYGPLSEERSLLFPFRFRNFSIWIQVLRIHK